MLIVIIAAVIIPRGSGVFRKRGVTQNGGGVDFGMGGGVLTPLRNMLL